MANISRKIKRCVMSFSFQERKEKELMRYRQEVNRLKSMDDDEFDLEYINLKAKYEHKKNVLSVFVLTIIISVLMDVWKYFYNFIEKAMQFVTLNQGNDIETAKVVFAITVIIIVFITMLILIMLMSHTRKMHQIYKNLMLVEGIRNKRYR